MTCKGQQLIYRCPPIATRWVRGKGRYTAPSFSPSRFSVSSHEEEM